MRIVVVSDTHGDFKSLERLVERQKARTDLFLHLGDGEREIAGLLALHPSLPLSAVRGNCDTGSSAPESRIVDAQGVLILMTHGHERRVKYSLDFLKESARGSGARIALFGHTHSQFYEYDNGLYTMNPGSLSQPRGSKAGYGVIEIRSGQILCNLVAL